MTYVLGLMLLVCAGVLVAAARGLKQADDPAKRRSWLVVLGVVAAAVLASAVMLILPLVR